jgi:hypothetical protein
MKFLTLPASLQPPGVGQYDHTPQSTAGPSQHSEPQEHQFGSVVTLKISPCIDTRNHKSQQMSSNLFAPAGHWAAKISTRIG